MTGTTVEDQLALFPQDVVLPLLPAGAGGEMGQLLWETAAEPGAVGTRAWQKGLISELMVFCITGLVILNM